MSRGSDESRQEPGRESLVAPRWQWSRMARLAPDELYAVLAARQQVFAVEQHCAFLDADGHDAHAWHLLGWVGDSGAERLVAYLRVLDAGRKFVEPSIGRVLTLPPYRGVGLGRMLMVVGIARTAQAWPGRAIRIAAQQRLERFYASLAFLTVSPPYDEDGIAHVDMVLGDDIARSGQTRG
jgi:ElaA protein